MTRHSSKALPATPAEVKARLKAKGWTHKAAATATGRVWEHVNRVLNERRTSSRLLRELDALPDLRKPKAKSPASKAKARTR